MKLEGVLSFLNENVYSFLSHSPTLWLKRGIPPVTGRLGCSLEGAGKRRIFAIGNFINQRLLYPIHKWMAEVLRMLPENGTFDDLAVEEIGAIAPFLKEERPSAGSIQ